MREKLRLAEVQPDADDSALLELSAREVRILMQRFGVRSESCPDEAEIGRLMTALEAVGLAVAPPPQFVPQASSTLH